jgi:hypothetical protein
MARHPDRALGRRAVLLAVLVAGPALAACSGGEPARQAVFHIQHGVQPDAAGQACQLHQTDPPTSAYRGGEASQPRLELPFLAYFTANGDKPYCDGKPSTDVDKQWAELYLQLTGNRVAIQRILSG